MHKRQNRHDFGDTDDVKDDAQSSGLSTGNCDITPDIAENGGRIFVGVQVGPCQLNDSCGMSEDLGSWDGDIYLGILTL